MNQYKLLTRLDSQFSKKFDIYELETAINEHAKNGWRVLHFATAHLPGFLGEREELIFLLEKCAEENPRVDQNPDPSISSAQRDRDASEEMRKAQEKKEAITRQIQEVRKSRDQTIQNLFGEDK